MHKRQLPCLAVLLMVAVLAPWLVSPLALTSYMLPWLVWTSATLGLNLIIGWAGQFHFGYAAVMGIGAYASVHGARHGIPWELAVVLGVLQPGGNAAGGERPAGGGGRAGWMG